MSEFNLQSFVEMVDISETNPGEFGHYPMQVIIKKQNDHLEINAMAVNSIIDIYNRIKKYISSYKEIFVSIDYPACFDMEHDFVLVIYDTKENQRIRACALPYNRKTGQRFKAIAKGAAVQILTKNYFDAIHENKTKNFKLIDFNK